MPFDPVTMAVGAGIQIGSAIIGWLIDGGNRAEAERIMAEADRRGMDINSPEFERVAYSMLPPGTEDMFKADPRVQQAFNASYDKLGQIADGGGLTTEDRAVQNQLMSRAQRAGKAGYDRITQNAQQTGTLGSGSALAMKMAQAQDSSQQYADISLDREGAAQKRAYGAIMDRAQLASPQRGQDHNEALAKLRIYEYNNNLKNRTMDENHSRQQEHYRNRVSDSNRQRGIASDQAQRQVDNGFGRVISGAGEAIGGTVAKVGSRLASQWKWDDEDYEDVAPGVKL